MFALKKKIALVNSVEGREWEENESFKYNFVFYFFLSICYCLK